jgi:hypothetical protein
MSSGAAVIELLAELVADVPLVFVAVTVKVYEVPVVNPVNVYGEDEVVCVVVAGLETIEYPVIEEPPVPPGVIVIVADVADAEAALILGAAGTVVAVTPVEAEEADDVPYALDAATVYVYCVLEDNPVMLIGEDVPVNVDGDVEGVGVTTNELGEPALVFGVNATDICPLLNARPEG